MPFLRNTLGRGGVITLRGRIVRKKDALVMEHPEIFYPSASYEEKRNTMQPVYALTAGLTNNAVKKAVAQALEQVEGIRDISSGRADLPISPSGSKNCNGRNPFPGDKRRIL